MAERDSVTAFWFFPLGCAAAPLTALWKAALKMFHLDNETGLFKKLSAGGKEGVSEESCIPQKLLLIFAPAIKRWVCVGVWEGGVQPRVVGLRV